MFDQTHGDFSHTMPARFGSPNRDTLTGNSLSIDYSLQKPSVFQGSHRSLLSGAYSANTQQYDVLSQRMFDHFNRDRSGHFTRRQIEKIIQEAYVGILPYPKKVTDEDIDAFIRTHDIDKDGSVGKDDWGYQVHKYVLGVQNPSEA